jgi:DNA-binding NarL/FixJ family response regulator
MRQRPFPTALVGQSALLREGISRILAAANFRIVASAARLDDVNVSLLPQDGSMLLVISAGEDADWSVRQIRAFKETHAAGRVAVVTDQYRLRDMCLAYRAGANVYFARVATCMAFVKSLELVMLGETILPPELLSFVDDGKEDDLHLTISGTPKRITGDLASADSGDVPRLSAREKCILHCIVEGASNKVIARKMDIAEATVKVHVKAILRKIRAHNRTQAAIWAVSNSSLLWPTAIEISESRMALPPPLDLGSEVEPARLAVPIRHGNGAHRISLAASLDSAVRKSIIRRGS